MDAVGEACCIGGHQFSKSVDITTDGVATAGPSDVRREDETGMASSLGLPRSGNDREVDDVIGEQATPITLAKHKQRLVFVCFPLFSRRREEA